MWYKHFEPQDPAKLVGVLIEIADQLVQDIEELANGAFAAGSNFAQWTALIKAEALANIGNLLIKVAETNALRKGFKYSKGKRTVLETSDPDI